MKITAETSSGIVIKDLGILARLKLRKPKAIPLGGEHSWANHLDPEMLVDKGTLTVSPDGKATIRSWTEVSTFGGPTRIVDEVESTLNASQLRVGVPLQGSKKVAILELT
jgi:hypothetical protein